jgi:tetratricopeptide (TPR) repeat protein
MRPRIVLFSPGFLCGIRFRAYFRPIRGPEQVLPSAKEGRVTGVEDEGELGKANFILRSVRGWRQDDEARAAGTTQAAISNLERGEARTSLVGLEELAGAMGYPPQSGRRTVAFLQLLRGDAAAGRSPSVASAMDTLDGIAFDAALELARASEPLVGAGLTVAGRPATPPESPAEARRIAVELWARLRPYPHAIRQRLVQEGREYQSFAVCEFLCAESEKAAADSVNAAVELAELALFVASLVDGDPSWRARLEGYAGAYLGNAIRVGGALQFAERTFASALPLWEAGAASDPGILDPIRLLDLEASLRKDQRRLFEALALLERALATGPAPETTGRLLIKKAGTLEKLGRNEEALAVLAEAAPLVEGAGRERLRFGIRFGVVVNLCALGRYDEAKRLLPSVQAMAAPLDKRLDLLRVRWLQAKVTGGLGRTDEAVETLASVKEEFADLGIAYDAALATLELAVLLLDHGRTAEVRELADQSKRIFDVQGVAREALATLEVFREAAAREALTAAFVRKLLDELDGRGGTRRD